MGLPFYYTINITKRNKTMKRVLLFLFLLNALTCFSQNRYTIYSITGDVQFKSRNGVEWTRAKEKMPLHLSDFLRIQQNEDVSILDSYLSCIYSSQQSGSYTVRSIIENAKDNWWSKMRRLVKELAQKSINSKEEPIRFRTIGGG